MRLSNKILVSCLLITVCLLGFSLADNDDCGLVATTTDVTASSGYIKLLNILGTSIGTSTVNYQTVIPPEALAKSFENLKKYCCQLNKIGSDFCKSFQNSTYYPESAYLFDHLIDVGFRRLDGRSDLAYGLVPDPTGKARRDFITKAAETTDGTTAKTIMDTYKTYRTKKITLPGDIVNFITNYNTLSVVSLEDKYMNLCEIMKDVYNKISEQKVVIGSYQNSFYNKCQQLAEKRISDEYTYTKVLLSKKSNELLHSTTQAYIQKYFIQDKMLALIDTVNQIKSLFSSMVQGAAVSKSCSK